jgi:hypothetical protein
MTRRLHAVPEKSLNRLGNTVVVAAVVALLVPSVKAQETPWTRQDALHEASSEAAQCQAYYSFAQKCADNEGRRDVERSHARILEASARCGQGINKQ